MALGSLCLMYSLLVYASLDVGGSFPVKLSDDDSFLTLSEVIIPSLAALASLSVAIVSVVIAWQARNIAKNSEDARMKAESDREKFEQQLRFDAALKDLYVGISQRIEALRARDAGVRANMFNIQRGGGGVPMPAHPPISSLLALIAAARLDARENEPVELLATVSEYANDVATLGAPTPDPETLDEREHRTEKEVDAWEKLLVYIDEWRHASPGDRGSILAEMTMATR